MSNLKMLRRSVITENLGVERTEDRSGNFFSDLQEARVELQAFQKQQTLSSRLVSERIERRLREKIRS